VFFQSISILIAEMSVVFSVNKAFVFVDHLLILLDSSALFIV
jgi:hypothetical protein